MKMKNKLIWYRILLTVIPLLLALLPLGNNMFFGSQGDWYSQHVGAAEHLRQLMLSTKNLIPPLSGLGGGSNIYNFAYYGLLRPDVLISCLLPTISMKFIIALYSLLGLIANSHLCFTWLMKKNLTPVFSFIGSLLFITAGCFLHAHHQIIFVNYMPFLLLALLGIDRLLEKNKSEMFLIALILIYFHSFYFAFASLFACLLYTVSQKPSLKQVGKGVFTILIATGIACILLLPIGLSILSTSKDGGVAATPDKIWTVNFTFSSLLYGMYGCGFTLITLYCLLSATLKKSWIRFLAIALLLSLLLPIVPYVLNLTLYARTKILIPLTPLVVLVSSIVLQELWEQKQKPKLLPLLGCLIVVLFSNMPLVAGFDFAILILLLGVTYCSKYRHNGFFILILAVPISYNFIMAIYYTYLPADDNRQGYFTQEEITNFVADKNYRYDCITDTLINSNYLPDGEIRRTSMYSSISNQTYGTFFYDIMANPISIRNRVALLPNLNSYFSYFMGIRYLQTTRDRLPAGYKVQVEKNNQVLAENKEVLPLAYGTSSLLSNQTFDFLEFPHTLEALTTTSVVEQDSNKEFVSHIEEVNIYQMLGITDTDLQSDSLTQCQSAQGFVADFKKTTKSTLSLPTPLKNKLLILRFEVENKTNKEVSISINNVKNKLSGSDAPYPNNHHTFSYILSSDTPIEQLNISFSNGTYTLKQLRVYTMDYTYLSHDSISYFTFEETSRNEVLSGNLFMEKDGYFITSLPYQKGYTAEKNGKPVTIEMVNKGFVGFPISKGSNTIVLSFCPPGKSMGAVISIFSLFVFAGIIFYERRSYDYEISIK